MWTSILLSGVQALIEYLSAHVLVCLVPAFFIAGAISSMVKKEGVEKWPLEEKYKRKSLVYLKNT